MDESGKRRGPDARDTGARAGVRSTADAAETLIRPQALSGQSDFPARLCVSGSTEERSEPQNREQK